MNSVAEELKALTPQEFEELSQAKRDELIEYNDEFVREWRATCQRCHRELRGTRHEIREHACDNAG